MLGMQNGPEDVADHDTDHDEKGERYSTDLILDRADDSVSMPQVTPIRWGRLGLTKYLVGSGKNAVKYLMSRWHFRSTAA